MVSCPGPGSVFLGGAKMKKIRNSDINTLREALKAYGIQTVDQLDKALSDSLDKLEVGIMTECLSTPAPEKTA